MPSALRKLDPFRKRKHIHAVEMQLISNLFRGWADTSRSSPISLPSPRPKSTRKLGQSGQTDVSEQVQSDAPWSSQTYRR